MKFVLILVLITLATFASGKPTSENVPTKYEHFLTDILTKVGNYRSFGVSYKLLKINSLTIKKVVNDKIVSCVIDADLKEKKKEKVRKCALDIKEDGKPYAYSVRFRCVDEDSAYYTYYVQTTQQLKI